MGFREAARSFAWWFGSVMGDRDYERYVAYRSTHHPGEPVASERDYWRDRYADAERNPRTRCC